jgi:hypothetical protein
MRFFSQFPRTNYKIGDDSYSTSIIDTFRHVDVDETLIDDLTTYTYYNIKDGERPDVVSYKLYDSAEYHWTFFIINETLKTGLNNWPRSFNEQADYIDKKYDHCSVLEFLPSQEVVDDDGESPSFIEGIKYSNYFNDIDFSDPGIILKNTSNNRTADTVIYDSDRLQLWVSNLSDPSFLSNDSATYVLDYKSDDEEALDTWLTNVALPFTKKFHPNVHDNLVEDDRLDYDDIVPYFRGSRDDGEAPLVVTDWNNSSIITDPDDDGINSNDITGSFTRGTLDSYGNETVNTLLFNEYLGMITFTTGRSWLKSYNAPYEYFDSDGNYVTTYDKLTDAPDSDDYISYTKAEENENEENTRIRVLRKVDVETFAERYKDLINE